MQKKPQLAIAYISITFALIILSEFCIEIKQ